MLRWAIILVMAAMLGGHFTELFDHWDHTLRTGRDADYTVVMLAACAGLVFAIANTALAMIAGSRRAEFCSIKPPLSRLQLALTEMPVTGPSPPLLLSLRI